MEWVESQATQYEEVYDPATKEVIAQMPLDYAIEVAAKAFEYWKNVPEQKRARILFNYRNLLQESKKELARIITIENGKNLTEALGEVGRGIENVEFLLQALLLL